MPLNDIYRCDFQMEVDNKVVSVSVHYQEIADSDGTPFEIAEALAGLAETQFFSVWWQGFASTELTYVKTVCQQVYTSRDRPAESTALTGDIGLDVASAMNGTTAVVFATYGIIWSKNFQGRIYLPGLSESSATEGRITTSQFPSMEALGQVFYDTPLAPLAPVNGIFSTTAFSPTLFKAGAPAPYSLISSTILRPRIGTQRRRRTLIASPS